MGSSESERLIQAVGSPRVLLFGLNNATTMTVLRGLLEQDVRPLALVVPDSAAPHLIGGGEALRIARPPDSPLAVMAPVESHHVIQQAWAAGLPVWVVRDLGHPTTMQALAQLSPDVGAVACFSRRIPEAILDLFPFGVLNVHPSLLPTYRGPSPLFWQLRAGEERVGVTVHLMDKGLDTGDVLAQTHILLPDGISGPEAARLVTTAGTELLIGQLDTLSTGRWLPQPQLEGGSYFGWPTADDFALSTAWTARQAFNFLRGTADWGVPYRLDVGGETIWLAAALAFRDAAGMTALEESADDELWLPFTEGRLHARLALHPAPLEAVKS